MVFNSIKKHSVYKPAAFCSCLYLHYSGYGAGAVAAGTLFSTGQKELPGEQKDKLSESLVLKECVVRSIGAVVQGTSITRIAV